MSKDTLIKYSDVNDNRSMKLEGTTGEVLNGYGVITASIYNAIKEQGEDAAKSEIIKYVVTAIENADKLEITDNKEGDTNGL